MQPHLSRASNPQKRCPTDYRLPATEYRLQYVHLRYTGKCDDFPRGLYFLRFTLYPVFTRSGRDNLVLRHLVRHPPLNNKDITSSMVKLNTAFRKDNIF